MFEKLIKIEEEILPFFILIWREYSETKKTSISHSFSYIELKNTDTYIEISRSQNDL